MFANRDFSFRNRSVADQMLESSHTFQLRLMKDDAGHTFAAFELSGTIGRIQDDDGELTIVESTNPMETIRTMFAALDSKRGHEVTDQPKQEIRGTGRG